MDRYDEEKIEAAALEGLRSGAAMPFDLDAIVAEAREAVVLEDAVLMRRALAQVEADRFASDARWSQDRMARAIGRKGGHVIREIIAGKRMMGPATRHALACVLRDGPMDEHVAAAALEGQPGLALMDGPTRRALAHELRFGAMDPAARAVLFASLPDAVPRGGRPGRPRAPQAAQ